MNPPTDQNVETDAKGTTNTRAPKRSVVKRILAGRRKFLMFFRRMKNRLGKNVHPTAYIAANVHVGGELAMKEHSFVNACCWIGCHVVMGRYAMLGPYVKIVGTDHIYSTPGVPIVFAGRPKMMTTRIEDDAWIGSGAIIMSGTTIGRGAIVAAGSVVTRDVPAYEIHAGVPAKKIRDRFENENQIQQHNDMLDGAVVKVDYCLPVKLREKHTEEED